MFLWANCRWLFLCAIAAVLGGCAVRPHPNLAHAPDWEDVDLWGHEPQVAPVVQTIDSPIAPALPVATTPFAGPEVLKDTTEPLPKSDSDLPKSSGVIVLDPGHGGADAGAKSAAGHNYEKDFTLDWALRLAHLLHENGWAVFLTRTSDVELALSNRVAFAERHRADLFLSLHFNSSAPDQTQSGLETYCLTPTGVASTVTRGFPDPINSVYPNNRFDSQNLDLALRVHKALLQVNHLKDRGIRRARFLGVLRNQQRPAVLIEGGYLSNPDEARAIAEPAHRQKLAEALAQALGRPDQELANTVRTSSP